MPGSGPTMLHFSEQLAPVTEWGTEFILLGLDPGSIFHITSKISQTIINISGFKRPRVRLLNRGQTIRRRLENGVTCHITSDKPIQVMMYYGVGIDYVITSMSMALMPAVEHYKTGYTTKCLGSVSDFQVNSYFDAVPINSSNYLSYDVAYTEYKVNIGSLSLSDSTYTVNTVAGSEFLIGGIMKCGSSVFPIGPVINVCIEIRVDTHVIFTPSFASKFKIN